MKHHVWGMKYHTKIWNTTVWGMKYHVWGMKYHVWGMKYHVWGMKYHVRGMKYHVWCMKYHVWGMKYHVRCMKYHVWGMKCHVWGMKYHDWSLKYHAQGMKDHNVSENKYHNKVRNKEYLDVLETTNECSLFKVFFCFLVSSEMEFSSLSKNPKQFSPFQGYIINFWNYRGAFCTNMRSSQNVFGWVINSCLQCLNT